MDNGVINLKAYREAVAFKQWRLRVTGRVAVTSAEVADMAEQLAGFERWQRDRRFNWIKRR